MPVCTVDVVVLGKDLKDTILFYRINEPSKGEFYTLGGRLNKDERPIDCAIRKLKEQIGVIVSTDDLEFSGVVYEIFDKSYFDDNVSSNFVNLVFKLIVDDEKMQQMNLDDQHERSEWFSVEDERLNVFVKKKIELALNEDKQKQIQFNYSLVVILVIFINST